MRKVEQRLVQSIKEQKSYSCGNTALMFIDIRQYEVRLHGRLIVEVYPFCRDLIKLRFSHCGWKTATTKSRLNAVLSLYDITIKQRNGEWFYRTDGFADRPFGQTETLITLPYRERL